MNNNDLWYSPNINLSVNTEGIQDNIKLVLSGLEELKKTTKSSKNIIDEDIEFTLKDILVEMYALRDASKEIDFNLLPADKIDKAKNSIKELITDIKKYSNEIAKNNSVDSSKVS